MKNHSFRQRAFTLTEIMVSIASASMMMVGILGCYFVATKMVSGGFSQLAIQAKARQGLDKIVFDVRKATAAGATIYDAYPGAVTNTDAGSYLITQMPTNIVVVPDQAFHHYYLGNLREISPGLTNGTLFFFTSADGVTIPAAGTHEEVVRGVTNPDRVFDWINGTVNINIRIADENDADGKQIIFLRSSVAFRNR